MAKFHNRTRKSDSISKKLYKEGKWYLIPLYHLLSLSFLAREGFKHSGSYRFADHIYKSIPKGKYGLGILIDSLLLSLPSALSFRNRYIFTRDEIVNNVVNFQNEQEINILSVPAGIPTTLVEASAQIKEKYPTIHRNIVFHCLDLDAELIQALEKQYSQSHQNFRFHIGDALQKERYPVKAHIIVSTGLGEFLSDKDLLDFYIACYRNLHKNGVFITSATALHKFSNYLMSSIGELHATYRTEEDMNIIFKQTLFNKVETYKDPVGYQTIVIAQK